MVCIDICCLEQSCESNEAVQGYDDQDTADDWIQPLQTEVYEALGRETGAGRNFFVQEFQSGPAQHDRHTGSADRHQQTFCEDIEEVEPYFA